MVGHVQGVALGVEQGHARQGQGGADRAHNQVLEGGLQSPRLPVAESGERHSGEGHDLHHDEQVEDVTREGQTQDSAGEHQEQGVIVAEVMVTLHVAQGIDEAQQEGEGDQQPEEQAQGVDLVADADGIAADRFPAAHPVGDHLSVDHDGLDEQNDQHERAAGGNQRDQIAHELVPGAEDLYQEGPEEQAHDRDHGKMVVSNHPRSLLISSAFAVLY